MSERTDEAKGRVKEAAGDLTDDERLKREGKMDRAGAGVKRAARTVKENVDRAVDSSKEKARDASDPDRS
jgi:uncharacterized protein YjbJ (UPF0337 family)